MRGKAAVLDAIAAFSRPGWRARTVAAFFSGGLKCIRPRNAVARENLRMVFPEASEEWIRDIVKKLYEHLAWMVAEYLALLREPQQVLEWCEYVEGKAVLDELKQAGRGAIILTGHVGNWELLAAWLAQSGYPLTAVVRNPDDPNLSEMITAYRTRMGVGSFEKHFVMKEAVRFAKRGGFLGLLPDQAWNATGVMTRFLGHNCYTAGGPAAMAHLARVPVVPVVSYRIAPFRHKVIISSPVPMAEGLDRDDSIQENTERMNKIIEEMILRAPEQWLWLHRRWK
ncbi:MAG: lysophospholipid acyltransferase family protein [Synergistaceae bacterium]|nr:lysophospholipid acyltransferase family protein [Synergistaceae bacterium]HPR90291.1 lysophospholipid acyltransferase family protein [Synergistaceae bacterium]HRV98367.1 lysophospholipid acyltransferase family protein [Aminobacteriaceae bacterium]